MVVVDVLLKSNSLVEEINLCKVSMTTYLHCNSCYFRPGQGIQRRFFITNCSHLYCEVCVSAATKDRCKVCKSQCSTLCLSGKIPKEVESMFSDPVESLQKFLKEFFPRLEFQKSHQKRLLKYMTEKLNSVEKKMEEVSKVIKQYQQLEREYFDLKSQNAYLKLLLSKKDGGARSGSRSGASPVVLCNSPGQLSSTCGTNHGFTTLQRQGGGSNISSGRLLIRTPPSGGRLGTIGGSCLTPTIHRSGRLTPSSNSGTPLTVPRPIQFNEKD